MWFLTAPIRSRLSTPPTRSPGLATRGVAAAFRGVARVRARPALHPRGLVVRGVVRRDGLAEPIGVPWIDEAGVDDAVVRLSRAAGLPRPFPDVLGLALRVDPDGEPADLLLSTAGRTPLGRHVLWPRYDARAATYTSIVAYRAPAGPVLLAAFPAAGRPALPAAESPELPAAGRPEFPAAGKPTAGKPTAGKPTAGKPTAGRPAFHLAVAAPTGPWRRFARLELAGTVGGDAPLAFDPVRRSLPGLELPEPLATLRAASYRASREGRASAW